MKKVILLLIIFLYSGEIFSQNSNNSNSSQTQTSYRDRMVEFQNIYSFRVDETTGDTLFITRMMNEFWFGVFGTTNVNLSYGGLFSQIDPTNPHNVIFNQIIDFNNKLGYGYSLGIIGEWARLSSDWGGGLKITVYDKKITRVGSDDVLIKGQQQEYDFATNLSYIIFTPFIKYAFPKFDGFFVSGGVDVAVIYNTVAYLEANYINTGGIMHRFPMNDIRGKTRFTGSLGVGYDFFIADFFGTKSRVRITPFADFKIGTNIITDNGSNWNDVAVNFGLQFKLAPDVVYIDTLVFDPEAERVPIYFATIRNEEMGVEFPRFTRVANPPEINLAAVTVPQVVIVEPPPADTPTVAVNVPTERPTTAEPRLESRLRLTPNSSGTLTTFASSNATALTPAQRAELDEIARFLRDNPGLTVHFTGHTDDRDAPTTEARARTRADNALNYLVRQGIPRGRVFADARGSRNPVAPNTTAEGRRRNNRIDYIIRSQ